MFSGSWRQTTRDLQVFDTVIASSLSKMSADFPKASSASQSGCGNLECVVGAVTQMFQHQYVWFISQYIT